MIKTQPLKLVKGIVLIVIGTLQFRGSASLIIVAFLIHKHLRIQI